MDFTGLLYSLGLSGFFASRAFLPAFASVVVLKYGNQFPLLNKLDFIEKMGDAPQWFTHPAVVWGLGILAALELVGDKSPEVRELLDKGSVYLKMALSAATTYGLLSATDAEAVSGVISQAGIFEALPAALSAVVTYVLAVTRDGAVSILGEADADDALGIRGLISWCEDLWALFGVWILLALPLVMVGILACVFGFLWLIRKRHERRMEAAKIACPNCQTRMHCFATACPTCDRENRNPRKLGLLGGLREETEPDLEAQKLRLLELKRSPKSGERAEGRGVDVISAADGMPLFGDVELTRRYLEMIDARLPKVALFTALVGLLPGIGLIIGVIYYRFQLVAPYRRYLPWTKGLAVRWLIRLLFLLLILMQFIPLIGAAAVPLMALINHSFYRSAFRSELRKRGLLPG